VGAPSPSAPNKRPSSQPAKRGLFGRIALFVRQVVAELKKVNTPTRSELFTYTAVVIVFVAVVMAFVSLLDFGIGKLVLWVFGG
jgi:preprotein translocase subunit SecE